MSSPLTCFEGLGNCETNASVPVPKHRGYGATSQYRTERAVPVFTSLIEKEEPRLHIQGPAPPEETVEMSKN
jgi:hypothetical protein